MGSDVFISYSSKDEKIAYTIYKALIKSNIKCWIANENIVAGEFANSIVEGIEQSKVLLLIFSSNSNESTNVLREIDIAVNNRLTIIPIRIEDVIPTDSMAYYLSTIHWIDMFNITSKEQLDELSKIIKLSTNKNVKSLDDALKKRKKKSYLKLKIALFILFLFIGIVWFQFGVIKKIFPPYFSQKNIQKNKEIFLITPNLLIYDFSHNLTNKEWNNFIEKDLKILGKQFDKLPKSILDTMDNKYFIKKIILIDYKNILYDYTQLKKEKNIKNIERISQLHFNLGRFYFKLKEDRNALNEFKKALLLTKNMNNTMYKDRYIANTYYAIGRVYRITTLNQYKKSEEAYLRAIYIYEKIMKTDKFIDKKNIADSYFGLGVLYDMHYSLYLKAIEHYEKSLLFSKQMKNSNLKITYMRSTYQNKAFCYQKLEKYDMAIKEFSKIIQLCSQVEYQDSNFYKLEMIKAYINISRLYFSQNQLKKSIDIETKILKIAESLDKNFMKKSNIIGESYANRGEYYQLLGNKKEAISDYNNALLFYQKDKNRNQKKIDKVILSLKKLDKSAN